MTHPDVPAEQAHVDHAYARLAVMRTSAEAMLLDAFAERGGTFQAVTERDIRVRNSLNRLEQLEIGAEALVFGRIDRRREEASPADNGPAAPSESFHIGRIAVSDEDHEPLVVDWRAPVAEPFYRATGAHPMGLLRRRHLLLEGRRIVELEDELFDPEGGDTGVSLGLAGPQTLVATLERARTGRMRDIVATVQREQDEIIRAPLPGVLVVQGGPGTGKTAVALHRAAYLLYTHRFPLESQGVLVVGPNPTFLRYIEHVLPSLDESGVELSTVTALFSGEKATDTEDRSTARIKGDVRMARLIANAVGDRQRPLRHTVEVPFGRQILRITPRISADVVAATRRRPGTHNARRRTFEAMLWRRLLDQVTSGAEAAGGSEAADDQLTAEELGHYLRRRPEMIEALERMWPVLTPQSFLRDLFGAPPLIDLAARDLLSGGERARLHRPRDADRSIAWTEADIALLDEARALLGPATRRVRPESEDEVRTFGHVVVDEAQDLSPMQLRMIGRRSLSGSMTVVGDIAQATGNWVPESWGDVVQHLPARRGWSLTELTLNYRTPVEIMEMARRVLEQVSSHVRPPEAVRSTGRLPRIVASEPGGPAAGVDSLVTEAVGDVLDSAEGTVGIVAPPSFIPAIGDALAAAGIPCGRVGLGALDERVTLLAVEDAKGLEFDTVVVVEPAALVAENPQGLRALYVAFTRATRDLIIVHSDPLPEAVSVYEPSTA
jgi:DNA helicase IV